MVGTLGDLIGLSLWNNNIIWLVVSMGKCPVNEVLMGISLLVGGKNLPL